MGAGIVTCLLQHGFDVIASEPDRTRWASVAPSDRFVLVEDVSGLAPCQLVIETITEDLRAKETLFARLEEHLGLATPIASNTSGYPISLLQSGKQRPERFVGMHWTSPPESTSFLEIIRGAQTNDETVKQVWDLAIALEKTPGIVHKDLPGFVANRLAYALYREAIHLLEEGVADVETIDQLCRDSLGLWTPVAGPFRWMDITGGPALYAKVMETILPTLDSDPDLPSTMRGMQDGAKRGSQGGEGFYRYGPDDDAAWQAKLRRHALKVWASRNEP